MNTIKSEDSKTERSAATGKPLQKVSWTEKIKNGKQWFKDNADYNVGQSLFTSYDITGKADGRDLDLLYRVYNNQFPMSWFTHITDPLNAKDPKHKKYPAKIRPTGMLRTNIDLLLGEYPGRPFVYQVSNLGEDGYNSYLENLSKAVESNLQEHFIAIAQQTMAQAGHGFEPQDQPQQIPLPESVKEKFGLTYKDKQAIRGQKWMKRGVREYYLKQKMLEMFKDWLIAGSAYSYKNIENGNFVYERIDPKELAFDRSAKYVEDGERAVRKRMITLSDAVDRYYDELKPKDVDQLEQTAIFQSPTTFQSHLDSRYGGTGGHLGLIPEYHVTWKGKKEVITILYTDPFTGQQQVMNVDEDFPIQGDSKVLKRIWVNEVYECTRLGHLDDDLYVRMRAIPVQRNEMNNFSVCKLPYNGRDFSSTNAQNTSVLEMGLPYASLYMITNYTLEKTLAKNKGKIALFDQNAMPKKNGWDEEKFFYYADALGYAMLDRNQQGVDKSWNQYHVLDLSLWDQIKNLIEIRDSFKKDWDDLLGINPQRKAQVMASAGQATTEQALSRSSVITDMIFTLFEEFTERDLQGMLDFSRFINVDGIKALYNETDADKELLDIDPNSYCNAELGLFITHSAQEMQTLQEFKNETQAMVQNGIKMSTILEVKTADNIAELREKLLKVEAIEMEQAQASQGSEQEHEKEIEEIRGRFAQIASDLKINEINAEWDRKDQNTMIKGEYDVVSHSQNQKDVDPGVDAAVEISKRVLEQQKIMSDAKNVDKEIAHRDRVHKSTMDLEREKIALGKQKIASDEKREKIKAAAAKAKARSSKSK